jgi:hypothetical protein
LSQYVVSNLQSRAFEHPKNGFWGSILSIQMFKVPCACV